MYQIFFGCPFLWLTLSLRKQNTEYYCQHSAPHAAAKTASAANISLAARVSTLGVGIEGSALATPNAGLWLGCRGYSHTQTSKM